MEYKGKLYGHLGGKMYFDTGKTADDWDELEKRVAELEAENQALRQPLVVGRSEQCAHPRDKREYIGSNMLRCKVCGKEFS